MLRGGCQLVRYGAELCEHRDTFITDCLTQTGVELLQNFTQKSLHKQCKEIRSDLKQWRILGTERKLYFSMFVLWIVVRGNKETDSNNFQMIPITLSCKDPLWLTKKEEAFNPSINQSRLLRQFECICWNEKCDLSAKSSKETCSIMGNALEKPKITSSPFIQRSWQFCEQSTTWNSNSSTMAMSSMTP